MYVGCVDWSGFDLPIRCLGPNRLRDRSLLCETRNRQHRGVTRSQTQRAIGAPIFNQERYWESSNSIQRTYVVVICFIIKCALK